MVYGVCLNGILYISTILVLSIPNKYLHIPPQAIFSPIINYSNHHFGIVYNRFSCYIKKVINICITLP